MYWASVYGHLQVVELLLSKGAEVDSRDEVSTYNNVMYCVIVIIQSVCSIVPYTYNKIFEVKTFTVTPQWLILCCDYKTGKIFIGQHSGLEKSIPGVVYHIQYMECVILEY